MSLFSGRPLLVLLLLVLPGGAAAGQSVIVPAANVDRAGLVVSFPAGTEPVGAVEGPAGEVLPVQVDHQGRGVFVVPQLHAGEEVRYRLRQEGPEAAGVAARRDGARLDVQVGGEPFFSYWVEERPRPRDDIDPLYRRGGFIHPVRTPAGVRVTDSYAANHLHHHGIWSPWTKTEFQGRTPDFWNMGQGSGKVEPAGLVRHWSGAVHGGFVARHEFIDLSAAEPVVALHETWEVTAYAVPGAGRPARVFDLVITQSCATEDPLVLPEYHYGGLGYRGHEQWNGADQARFLTSEGLSDREQAHATRARWCHIGGAVDGQLAGTAILGHPDNVRAPQPMRIHPDEPFFCFAPPQLGRFEIRPGAPYVARYRFVVMDGEPDAALLEAYWQAFAHPVAARVEAE